MIWAAGLISMIAALVATQLAIAFSLRRGVLDVPNPRSSHSQPVPRLGGIGMLAGVVVAVGFTAAMGPLTNETSPILTRAMLVMVGAGLSMSAIGLWDDLFGMRPAFKLLCQLAVAAAVVALGYRVESVQIAGWSPILLGLVSIPVTVLWFAGFTNIFNFMDGINGISAVTAAVYFLFFSLFAWLEGASALVCFAVIFAGGCLGFLPHNFPRARTFMGDTGSLMLGIVLSFQVVYLIQLSPQMLIPMLLVCSLYLWDSGFTILCRLKRRENIFEAHRTHLYQRLVKAGHSHARITVLYFLLHLVMGSLALAWYGSRGLARAGVITLSALVLGAFTARVYQVEGQGQRGKASQDQETAA